jgi:fatty acid synthase
MKEKNIELLVKEGEEVVISGMSGRFPESDNTDELAKNLYNNVDMITGDDRRWPTGDIHFNKFLI